MSGLIVVTVLSLISDCLSEDASWIHKRWQSNYSQGFQRITPGVVYRTRAASANLITTGHATSPWLVSRYTPLQRSPQQLHRPVHECTLGNAATLSSDVPRAVHEPHPPLPMYSYVSTLPNWNAEWPGVSFLHRFRLACSALAAVHPPCL